MLIKQMRITADRLKENSVLDSCVGKKSGYLNPYSYYVSRKSNEKCLPDNVFADGLLLVFLLRLIGIRMPRLSFDMTSMAPIVFGYAQENGKRIAILGGKQDEVKGFCRFLCEYYPGVEIVLAQNGYEFAIAEFAGQLQKMAPDIVVIGMGAPLQDQVMRDLYEAYPATYFTCGGFISQSAAGLEYYPALINKLNLRFIYRACKEPHYRKRLFIYPFACLLFLKDAIFTKR